MVWRVVLDKSTDVKPIVFCDCNTCMVPASESSCDTLYIREWNLLSVSGIYLFGKRFQSTGLWETHSTCVETSWLNMPQQWGSKRTGCTFILPLQQIWYSHFAKEIRGNENTPHVVYRLWLPCSRTLTRKCCRNHAALFHV